MLFLLLCWQPLLFTWEYGIAALNLTLLLFFGSQSICLVTNAMYGRIALINCLEIDVVLTVILWGFLNFSGPYTSATPSFFALLTIVFSSHKKSETHGEK